MERLQDYLTKGGWKKDLWRTVEDINNVIDSNVLLGAPILYAVCFSYLTSIVIKDTINNFSFYQRKKK